MIQQVKDLPKSTLCSPAAVRDIIVTLLAAEHKFDREKEHFWVIGLNTKNYVEYGDLATLGVLDASLVHPREVFRLAVHRGVSSIMLAHNHPSGDPMPSKEDRRVTDRLIDAGNIIGIAVIDHVIVGNSGEFVSYKSGW
ncbi:MAG: hypothetical protein HYV60_07675 [Planctomycetia bacterium]|nr:hypothetical protein [Planctomycetia bacterium]